MKKPAEKTPKLKPCPRGHKASMLEAPNFGVGDWAPVFRASCGRLDCWIIPGWHATKASAARTWNRRGA